MKRLFAGLAVLAVAAGVLVAVLTRGESALTMARQAGQAVAAADGLRLAGTIDRGAGINGRGLPASFSVTRAGSVIGTFTNTTARARVRMVEVGGVPYWNAPAVFWAGLLNGMSDETILRASGNWARAPLDLAFDVSGFTAPRIARILENPGPHPGVTSGTLGGTKIIRLTSRGMTFSVTTATPSRLIALSSDLGNTHADWKVTPLTAATIGPVFGALHADVTGLRGAVYATNIKPAPELRLVGCGGPAGCTATGPVQVADPNLEDSFPHPRTIPAILEMTVSFAGAAGGTPFASCHAAVPVAVSGEGTTVPAGCSVTGPAWAGWFSTHGGSAATTAHFDTVVNSASDVAAMQAEISREQAGR